MPMQPTEKNETEYVVSIRITLPETVRRVIKKEKDRFASQYGSGYKSEPHVTLYLSRYTKDGFSKVIHDLKELHFKQFTFLLLSPKMVKENGLRRNLYIVDVSNKEQLRELHNTVVNVADRYRSPLLREKEQKHLEQGLYSDSEWYPHISLGEVGIDDAQPELSDIEKNLRQIRGEEIVVLNLTVFFHGRERGEEEAKLVKEVLIPF